MASTSHRGNTVGLVNTAPQGGLLDLLAFGVLPDGTTDNSAVLAAAVIYARTNSYAGMLLPPGITQCSAVVCLDLTGVTDFVLAGSGPDCVLRMNQDFVPDRKLIYLANGSSNITLRDFTCDGNWTNQAGNEQVHLVVLGYGEATGTVSDVTIRNMWFRDCKGDAVRLLGADAGGEVTGVRIDSCRFTDTDRCGIAVQRGTYDVHITNNHFVGGSDQQLDMEATSESAVGRYIVTGNTFDGTGRVASTFLVTLGGASSTNPNSHTVFANNVVRGRIQVTNVVGLRFNDNLIVPPVDASTEATVNFIRVCKGSVISGNHFERAATSGAGPVVQITQNSALTPDGVIISGNTFVQNTSANCLNLDGADTCVVEGNLVRFFGTSSIHGGITLEATNGNLESVLISGNTIVGHLGGGTLGNGVHINARTNTIGRAVVSGNIIRSATQGVQFEKGVGGTFTNFPVCLGNNITDITTAVLHTAQTLVVGGQQGAVCDLVGSGSPEAAVTAAVGSTFRRNDGGASTMLYAKETGTGNTGWVAIAGTGAATVADGSITLAKLANLATDKLIGRDTAGTGVPEALDVSGGLEFTGTGIQRSALSGDISATAGSGVTAIGANKVLTAHIADANVTLAKLANVATATFVGRTTPATGVPEALTVTQATALLNAATSTLKGLVPAPGNTTYKHLRDDATFAAVGQCFQYGASTIATGTASTAFGVPGGDNSAPSTTQVPITLPWDISIISVRFTARGTSGTSGTVTIRLRSNGADSGVTIAAPINTTNGTTTSTTGCPYAVAAGQGLCAAIETTSLLGTYQGWAVVYEYVRTS